MVSRFSSRRGYYNRVQAALAQNDTKILDRDTIQNAEEYVSLHAQLLEELPLFLEGTEKLLEILLGAFSLAQKDYYNGMQAHIRRFFYTVKLPVWGEGADVDDSVRKHPESGPESVPDGTTIMRIWYNAWTPEQEGIQTLGLVSSEFIYRNAMSLRQHANQSSNCCRYWTPLCQFWPACGAGSLELLADLACITEWRADPAGQSQCVKGPSQSQFVIYELNIENDQSSVIILTGTYQR